MVLLRPAGAAVALALLGLAAAPAQAAGGHAPLPPSPARPGPADLAKRAACEKVWAVQKVRHGARATFVAACVAKG